jgi:hypothetical protein
VGDERGYQVVGHARDEARAEEKQHNPIWDLLNTVAHPGVAFDQIKDGKKTNKTGTKFYLRVDVTSGAPELRYMDDNGDHAASLYLEGKTYRIKVESLGDAPFVWHKTGCQIQFDSLRLVYGN